MKKYVSIVLFLFASTFVHADEGIEFSDPTLWRALKAGNYSLSYRLMHNRPSDNTNDEIMNQFMMAYLYYRMGKTDEEVIGIFKGVDAYLDYHLKTAAPQ